MSIGMSHAISLAYDLIIFFIQETSVISYNAYWGFMLFLTFKTFFLFKTVQDDSVFIKFQSIITTDMKKNMFMILLSTHKLS